ncbi:MAG TPA: hypothetical protein VMZ25_10005 [Terriglobales bacterium]|nr:hypothetical protein [Terriglobales bacterium]
MNDKLANNSGNLFRASDKQTTSGKVELEWLDDRNLVVKHSKSIELYHDSNDVNGVHVVFETY